MPPDGDGSTDARPCCGGPVCHRSFHHLPSPRHHLFCLFMFPSIPRFPPLGFLAPDSLLRNLLPPIHQRSMVSTSFGSPLQGHLFRDTIPVSSLPHTRSTLTPSAWNSVWLSNVNWYVEGRQEDRQAGRLAGWLAGFGQASPLSSQTLFLQPPSQQSIFQTGAKCEFVVKHTVPN